MTAPPAARPLFPATHHMPFAYPSPASTIASDAGLHWNAMSPPQEPDDGPPSRQPKSSSPTARSPDKGTFRWITATNPGDFKTRVNMQTVRQKAMGSYLETAKSQPSEKYKTKGETPNISPSNSRSQGATKPRSIITPKVRGKKPSDKVHTTPEKPSQPRPNSEEKPQHDTQVAQIRSQAPIVIPIVTGRIYPFDKHPMPKLVSTRSTLDPFGTMFQSRDARVSVERLKHKCSAYFGTEGLGRHWIPICLNYPHTFLSTLYMASAYDDVVHNREVETWETAALRQDVIHLVRDIIKGREQSVADHNIIAVSQLILGDVISRSEASLLYHQTGMEAMIKERHGLGNLGVNGELASAVSWANLATAILREAKPTPMYVEYCTKRAIKTYPLDATIPESPLYQPHGTYTSIEQSPKCKPEARKLLNDIRMLTEESLDAQSRSRTGGNPPKLKTMYERIIRYPSVQQIRRTVILKEADWRYEAIRLTAIVQAQAVFDQVPLSEALKNVQLRRMQSAMDTPSTASQSNDSISSPFDAQHVTPVTDYSGSPTFGSYSDSYSMQQPGFPFGHRHSNSSTYSQRPSFSSQLSSSSDLSSRQQFSAPTNSQSCILQELRDALENSDLSECWSDMAGVLLWIGLVMGAASNQNQDKILRRYFSATTIRACIILCFEHPEAIHSTMLKMTQIVEALSRKHGDGQLVRKDSFVSRKRTKA